MRGRTLAIECATESCSVALFDGEQLMASDHRVIGRGHAERLIPMIAALPDRGHAQRILVSRGPGSFTGVRIGIAAASALTVAWQAELLAYPTLDLIAAMAREAHGAVDLTVCMTGGHGQWFVQNFDAAGAPLAPVASLTPQEATDCAEAEIVVGTQAQSLVELRQSGEAVNMLPDARKTVLLPSGALSADIAPIYGRAPDAKPAQPAPQAAS